ncbi:(2Fe-2S)-binding protein [Mycobacterium kansasii]|uniref:Naphthalene 1,2-dioxygenase system ferredoxin subunit n=1 Tax=Mycobacterium attenuatum TaxID=2341086 RepID=A0A498PVC3_9MYCO|nr:Rieske 2Fe-2S domain-containing protein [Mycobacterium attenuatum]ORB86574.1 (2Fe-2S)-binding protein [Mycobacterium kansasii]VBA37706.1 Naphthalene 1,2-dioxygenase system ferredoxin subunit [Mycobacterium attenuatum]VBA50904.1 Naphthalene 1,2-dioxygenase system ferredoxin subunit [Mycobacterium attenuatum]VBA56744.1 Naphthalene 1,2-dioxygenase system ferredoxin subunit [Mycobacterium attenuatum]
MAERPRDRQPHKFGSRVLAAIGRQEWLDRPSYRLEHLISFGFNALGGARDRVTNALNGVWLGHPVHPPLTSFASGALGTTVALDALSVLPGRPASEVLDASRFASRALGLGIAASVGSAVTGIADWQHTHEEDRRVGLVHGLVNTAATALYVMSWLDRRRGHHIRGIAASALGYAITVGGAYLGGALVFESGIGIDQSGGRLRTRQWTPVLPASSLNGKPVRVEVDGVGLVVCQTKPGEVSAFGEFCPHLAAPMADGWIDRGRLVCPWHGSRFALESGEVLRGPSAAPLPCYEARVVDGVVEVRGDGHEGLPASEGIAK